MNRIDELTTYTAGRQLIKELRGILWRVCIHNKPDGCGCVGENKKICFANLRYWEISRNRARWSERG